MDILRNHNPAETFNNFRDRPSKAKGRTAVPLPADDLLFPDCGGSPPLASRPLVVTAQREAAAGKCLTNARAAAEEKEQEGPSGVTRSAEQPKILQREGERAVDIRLEDKIGSDENYQQQRMELLSAIALTDPSEMPRPAYHGGSTTPNIRDEKQHASQSENDLSGNRLGEIMASANSTQLASFSDFSMADETASDCDSESNNSQENKDEASSRPPCLLRGTVSLSALLAAQPITYED